MFEEFKITNCIPLAGYRLDLTFSDGAQGVVDVSHLAGKGVFAIWNNFEAFKSVEIDPVSKTVSWANGMIDLDPFKLRDSINHH